jgi:hypothetical protein
MRPYEQTLVVYLDILGFKQLIAESATNPEKAAEIVHILAVMKKQASLGATKENSKQIDVKTFSDLVVRASRLPEGDSIAMQITMEVLILAAIQCELLLTNNVLVRGGVCLDDLYVNEDVVFGPALVQAYHHAEQMAVFPRIVVDSRIIDVEKQDATIPILNTFVIRGDDGAYFIDYLFAAYSNWQILIFDDKWDTLRIHKERVEEKLRELPLKGERAKHKALWLALYHNSVLERLGRRTPDIKEKLAKLFITEEQIRI